MANQQASSKSLAFFAGLACQTALWLAPDAAFAQAVPVRPADVQDTAAQSSARDDDLRGQSEAMFNFNVPPGTLKSVLDDIAAQSGSRYRADRGGIPDVKSPGIVGHMTLHEAVVRAVAGTGLRPVSVRSGEIRLAAEDGGREGDIVVIARRSPFKSNFTSAATRTNTPLRQTPATVDVVTSDVLESRNAFSLGEALRNIPGAIFQAAGAPNQVRFGPQSTGGATFTDGLRNGSLNDNTPTAMLDSIEVVKGPASILTGTQAGGGLVNYVPKRANGISAPEITLGVGSGGEVLASADFGGAIPGVNNLYFRVIVFAQNARTNPAGGNDPYQYLISPMLGYRSDNTTIDLNLQYAKQRIPFARRDYFPTATVNGTLVATGPIQSLRGLYSPDSLLLTEYKQVNYNIEQNLATSSDFTLKLRARGLYQDGRHEIAAAAVSAVVPAAGLFVDVSISQYAPEWTTSHAADLYAKFGTGPLEHQLIIGAEYSKRHFGRAVGAVAAVLKIDQSVSLAPVPYGAPLSDEPSRQYGVYVQDQINWGPAHALLGVRHSWYDSSALAVGATVAKVVKSQKWTPTFGLVFDVLKQVSIYASYTQAFSPQTASTTSFTGDPLPPSLQTRYEGGFKAGLFDNRLDLNGSLFWVTTDAEARADPAHIGFSVPGPGRTAHGYELSATGSVTPTFKVSAGYTYTTGKLINGDPLDQAPQNVANLWMVKSFRVSDTSKIDFGLGGNFYDKFYIGSSGAYVLFDRNFLSVDSSIGYTMKKIRLNLTVSNILDRRNYALSGASFQLEEAPPRVVRFVVSAKF